jgi:hypothetical protein
VVEVIAGGVFAILAGVTAAWVGHALSRKAAREDLEQALERSRQQQMEETKRQREAELRAHSAELRRARAAAYAEVHAWINVVLQWANEQLGLTSRRVRAADPPPPTPDRPPSRLEWSSEVRSAVEALQLWVTILAQYADDYEWWKHTGRIPEHVQSSMMAAREKVLEARGRLEERMQADLNP